MKSNANIPGNIIKMLFLTRSSLVILLWLFADYHFSISMFLVHVFVQHYT